MLKLYHVRFLVLLMLAESSRAPRVEVLNRHPASLVHPPFPEGKELGDVVALDHDARRLRDGLWMLATRVVIVLGQ